MWANNNADSKGMFPAWMRKTVGPFLLMAITPVLAILFVHATYKHQGSMYSVGQEIVSAAQTKGYINGPLSVIYDAACWPSMEAIKALLCFAGFELALMRLVPGKDFKGPVSPSGHVPVYKANGLQSFFITVFTFLLGDQLGWWKASRIYTLYPEMITTMCLFSFLFCGFLYVKGLTFPSGADSGSSGYFFLDFYWGTELYPRVLGWDVKMFTNCRFGMMAWAIIPISCLAYATEQAQGVMPASQAVNTFLQLVYVAKFFWWETGYLRSIDIMHDRAGYYICWGCLVWVPSLYVCHSVYMTQHAASLVWPSSYWLALALAGWLCIYINYDADRQREFVRRTDGQGLVWGAKPKIIRATYTTEDGNTNKSLLLVSGWWAVSRHFHYLPEIAAACCWTLPAGTNHFLPWAYVVFLTFLLLDRAFRDDARCQAKYGKYWDQYCAQVPYKVVPGLL